MPQPQPKIDEATFRSIASTCTMQKEICEKTGLSPASVCKFVTRYGLDIKHRVAKPSIKQLQADIDAGLSATQISLKHGLAHHTIITYLNKIGLSPKKTCIHSSITDEQLIKEAATKSMLQINREYGIAPKVAAARLRAAGFGEYTDKRGKVLPTKEQLQTCINIGVTHKEISKQYNISSNTILKLFKKYGLRSKWFDPESKGIRSRVMKEATSSDEYRHNRAVAQANIPRTMTAPHKKVCAILDTLGIKYANEYTIGPYLFDIFIEDKNILIEVNGDYWHNLANAKRNDAAKSTYISNNSPQYKIIYIWEHECLTISSVEAKLKYLLGIEEIDKVEYEFDQLGFAEVDKKEADEFLYNWHYQHTGRTGTTYGLYLNKELICVARFTPPHRREIATSMQYTPEEVFMLSRLVIHPRYRKKNLLSWFLARCEAVIRTDNQRIKCLVSFADMTYGHTGAAYKASNWILNRVVEPDYWYVDERGWTMHKKTLWDHARAIKQKEKVFADENGYTKVYGKEKYKYIKVLR